MKKANQKERSLSNKLQFITIKNSVNLDFSFTILPILVGVLIGFGITSATQLPTEIIIFTALVVQLIALKVRE